jgi:hypothetical protein
VHVAVSNLVDSYVIVSSGFRLNGTNHDLDLVGISSLVISTALLIHSLNRRSAHSFAFILFYFIWHKFSTIIMYTRIYIYLLLAFALGIILVSSVPVDPRSQLAEVSFSL